MVPKTRIAPMISKAIYQSGPFKSTGKKLTGCIQFKKTNPDSIRMTHSQFIPCIIVTTKKLMSNTIQYTGAIRQNRSMKDFLARGGGVSPNIVVQNRIEIPAPVRIKKKLTATVQVSVKRYSSQFQGARLAMGRY